MAKHHPRCGGSSGGGGGGLHPQQSALYTSAVTDNHTLAESHL